MLPLPVFRYHRPTSVEQTLSLLATLGDKARLIAGGTDVLPNMKHGLFEPEHVVSLGHVTELEGVTLDASELVVGSMTKLAAIAEHPSVRLHAPALAEAASQVGGPHHRAMGTLGGNICLDTRCRYYNQTYFWRKALGFCLKKDGTVCHVVAGGSKCVAAASNDTAPVLVALQAQIGVMNRDGERWVAAGDFYTADGIRNTVLEQGDLVSRVRIPCVAGRRSAFEKLRRRGAIDFPLLSIGARVDFATAMPDVAGSIGTSTPLAVDVAAADSGAVGDGSSFRSSLTAVEVVVSALGARPRRIRAAQKIATGSRASAQLAASVAQSAFAECKPLKNVDEDIEWRREMVRVLVEKALERCGLSG